jgi:hypothetical protein
MIIKLVDFRVVPGSIDNNVYKNAFDAEYMDDYGAVVQLSCVAYNSYNYDNLEVNVSTTSARQKFVNAAIESFIQLVKNTNSYIDCIAYDDEQQCEEG